CPALRGVTFERIEGPLSEAEIDGVLAQIATLREKAAPFGRPLGPGPTVPDAAAAPEPARAVTEDEERAEAVLLPALRGEAAGRGVVRLRFERLMRGDAGLRDWFDREPDAFTAAFRRFHAEVRCGVGPWDEARAWAEWSARRIQ